MKYGRMVLPGLLTILALPGCDSSSSGGSPTAPRGPLMVQADSTATQIEPEGHRVQVRMVVIGGADSLRQATFNGSARGQSCISGSCVEQPLTAFGEGRCAGVATTPAGGARLGIAVAWADGDRVGLDLCLADMTGPEVIETTVTDGLSRSNVVRTSCTPAGTGLFCASS